MSVWGGVAVLLPLLTAAAVVRLVVHPDAESAIAALETSHRWRVGLELGGGLFGVLALVEAPLLVAARLRRTAFGLVLVAASLGLTLGWSAKQRRDRFVHLPHILLLTLDGFNASHMGLYGAARAPTPFLDRLGQRSLVARNFFPQACCTASGIYALLSGRLPLEAGVLYPPHQLRELDQHRSLVALLSARGYRTVQLTEPAYSDANQLLLRGFDRVNGVQRRELWLDRLPDWGRAHGWAVAEVARAVLGRVLPVLPIEVTASGPLSAKQKVDELLVELDGSSQPLFAHVHFLESHGPRFDIEHPLFSQGKTQDAGWLPDFYDDALRELDEKLAYLHDELAKKGLLESTVIIVSSDHGSAWRVDERMPFLLAAPGLKPRQLLENAQPIDLGPTLMSLLGWRAPAWMSGRSLLARRPPDAWRTILAGQIHGQAPHWYTGRWEIEPGTSNRGLGIVNVIVCDHSYAVDLTSGELVEKRLAGTFAPCAPPTVPKPLALLRTVVAYLQQHGYAPQRTPFVGRTIEDDEREAATAPPAPPSPAAPTLAGQPHQ